MRKYRNISKTAFSNNKFLLVPIRDEDKFEILKWRNEQIEILRQQKPLTKEDQEKYFKNVVDKLFETEKPDQLLFSFLEDGNLIGYGGLVHIDWENRNAEISFITETKRNIKAEQFISDWFNYLTILKQMVKEQLNFIKIYTFAYDLRPNLYLALEASGFIEEKRLKSYIVVNGKDTDVLIHSCFLNDLVYRMTNENDVKQYFEWVNDLDVRKNSFSTEKIIFENHQEWFRKKLTLPECLLYFFIYHGDAAGQVRIERVNNEWSIDISVDKAQRGKSLGTQILKMALYNYRNKYSDQTIYSYVKKDNSASLSIFLKANFEILTEIEVNKIPTYKLALKAT